MVSTIYYSLEERFLPHSVARLADGSSVGRSTMIKTRIVAKVSLRNGERIFCIRFSRTCVSLSLKVAWRQALYASAREEINGVLVEEPSIPVANQVAAQQPRPPVNQGIVKTGLRMMVSRMMGYA